MSVIDIHIHVFGDWNKDGTCHMSSLLGLGSHLAELGGFLADVPTSRDDDDIRDAILHEIQGSQHVNKGVLLAFDKPHDNAGTPMKPILYTPNSWVAEICRKNPDLALFGASVHPYNTDALKELQKAKDDGAVLVKWIPSSQNILPSHEKCRAFYQKLIEYGLPLLCHVGDEHTISEAGGDKSLRAYNHPELLIPALEEGVTVIMAHCCLPIDEDDNDFSEAFMRMMLQAEDRGWRLFADVSALVGKWRRSFMAKQMALRLPHDRLVMGSDWPNAPNLDDDFRTKGNRREYDRIKTIDNVLDRNAEYLKFLGFSDTVMTNAEQIFKIARTPPMPGNPRYSNHFPTF